MNSDLKQIKLFRQYSIMDIILASVCGYYNIAGINTRRRKREHIKPMQVAMSLSRKYTLLTTTQIGEFYNKTHADVLHNCRVIENDRQIYKRFKKEYEVITADILSRINYL